MTSLSKKKVSESGHWYTREGDQVGLIENSSKPGFRNPTVRDARKHNWGPGVTSVISMLNAPALSAWKVNRAIDAAVDLVQFLPAEAHGNSEFITDEWRSRVNLAATEISRDSAKEGTNIHAAIEKAFCDEEFDEFYRPHVTAVHDLVNEHCKEALELHPWMPEQGVSHPLGYGTKSDLHSGGFVLDFKSKDGDQSKLDDARTYDYHWMQLAATRAALERSMEIPFHSQKCGIIFVSRNHPGACAFKEVSDEELFKGWKLFTSLLTVWQVKNNHTPAWGGEPA
tara:strand:- start:163 stop:1011 length:849 start_codon:yes stop_codon:yes gene_type:complete